jgi:hypothetical protein
MSTIIEQNYASNNVVFDADYRTGSVIDRSPYAAAATITAPTNWTNSRLGKAILVNTTGYISYDDNSANRLAGSNATFIIFGNLNIGKSERIICKRNPPDTSYDIYSGTVANRIDFYDGTDTSFIYTSLQNKKLIVITLVNASNPICYIDGTYAITGTASLSIPNKSIPLAIGNPPWARDAPLHSPLNRITILNRALSSQEVAQLWQELKRPLFNLGQSEYNNRIANGNKRTNHQ